MVLPALIAALAFPPPSLVLRDPSGTPHNLLRDPAPKATVLIVGITDCPIARGYVPTLNRLESMFKTRGARMYFVSVDPHQKPEELAAFRKSYSLTCQVLLDLTQQTVQLTGARAVPTAAVFDSKGVLRYVGAIDDRYPALGIRREPRSHYLDEAIRAVLGGHDPKVKRTTVTGCIVPAKGPK